MFKNENFLFLQDSTKELSPKRIEVFENLVSKNQGNILHKNE
jgi:hypothetical protein